MSKSGLIVLSLLLCFLPAASFAQSEGNSEKVEKSEEEFDAAIEEFGDMAGAAFICLEGDDLNKHEERVYSVYHRIVELFGSDRAFKFAVAYGHSAAAEKDPAQCDKSVDAFEDKYGPVAEKYNLVD